MSAIPQLCFPAFVGVQDPTPTVLVPSYDYAAFPASLNVIAPLLHFEVSTRRPALASPLQTR